MRQVRFCLGVACAMCVGVAAQADTQTFSANLQNWGADGGGDGLSTTPSVIVDHTFTLPAITSLDSLSFDFAHSFMSDVHIEIITPLGATLWITEGQGNANGYASGFDSRDLGDGTSLLAGTSTYVFVQSGGGTWTPGVDNPVPAGDYNALNWAGGGFAAGDWTVRVLDVWDTVDGGAVGDVVIEYTVVPAPAALALLGVAGLFGARRRRG